MGQLPRQRDAERSRAAILDAAEELFAQHGFEAVTMAQIGARAGVSRGTPGYFFGAKEALYRVVVERAAATLRMLAETLRLRDAAGRRSRDEIVADTVDAFLGLLLARRSVVRLLDRETGMVEGEPHVDAMRGALAGLGDDADRIAMMALSLCWFPLSHPDAARALGCDPDAPEFPELWRRRVLTAVAAEASVTGELPDGARTAPDPVQPEGGRARGDKPKKKKKKKKKSADS